MLYYNRKFHLAGLALFFALALTLQGKAEEKPIDNSPSQNEGRLGILKLLPLHTPCYDVRVPRMESGFRVAMMECDELFRIDDQHLRMRGLYITRFDAFQEPMLEISIRDAYYVTNSDIIFSESKTYISSPNYKVEGAGIVYDTNQMRGKIFGKVKMRILLADKTTNAASVQE